MLQNAPQCNSNSIHLPQGRLRIDEIQQSPNTSIFSSMLFTCPVPTRCDGCPMAEVVTIPLRRHLRIIHAAVIAAFTAMQVQSVRSWHARRASGLPPVADEQPYRAGVGGGGSRSEGGGARRTWVLQISPQLIDIEACARQEGAFYALLRRHANLIKQGDAVFIWKTGSVELKDSGLWEPVTGGLVAMGSVRLGPEVQARPTLLHCLFKSMCRMCPSIELTLRRR